MRKIVITDALRTAGFWMLIAATTLCFAQASTSTAQPPTLQEFFESIRNNPASLPPQDEVERVQGRISAMTADEVAKALPTVLAVLASDNPNVKRYAAGALLAVSLRPDSAQLLRGYITPIASLLNSPEDYLQRGALAIFAFLKPAPPAEVFPYELTFLKRTDRDSGIQVGALGMLLRYRPKDPEVVQVVQNFSSRPLEAGTRMHVIDAIGLSATDEPRFQELILHSLDDPSPGVKVSAINALNRMGKDVLMKAEPVLRALEHNPEQHPEVRAAASKALKSIDGGPPPTPR
jgi:HEAT repeat protein